MSMPKFKFNFTAIIELIIVVILIPITWTTWTEAIANCQYYLNIEKAVGFYNTQRYQEMEDALDAAVQAHPQDAIAPLFHANYFMEQKQFDKAMTIYETFSKSGYENTALPRIGYLVCRLQQTQQEKSAPVLLKMYTDMEEAAKNIVREHPNSSDILVVWAHIALKKSIIMRQNRDDVRADQMEDFAWQTLQDVQKKTEEQAQFFTTLDKDHDGKIHISEWTGKKDLFYDMDLDIDMMVNRSEVTEIWDPPSYDSVHSMYVAQALISYQRAIRLIQKFDNKYLDPASTEATMLVTYLETAIRSLQAALTLRAYDPTLAANIATLYSTMLSLPCLTPQQSRQFVAEAKSYMNALEAYQFHLHTFNKKKLESTNLNGNISLLYYGIALGSYYIAEPVYAQEMLARVGSPISPDRITKNKIQVQLYQIDKECLQTRNFEKYTYQHDRMMEYHNNEILNLPNNVPLTLEQFNDINNTAVLLYMNYKFTKNHKDLIRARELLEKYRLVMDYTCIVGNVEVPVTLQQIRAHNLYMILCDADPRKAASLEKSCLRTTPTKE